MKVITTQDTKTLIVNKDHKNFTEGKETIPTGTELIGNIKYINFVIF